MTIRSAHEYAIQAMQAVTNMSNASRYEDFVKTYPSPSSARRVYNPLLKGRMGLNQRQRRTAERRNPSLRNR